MGQVKADGGKSQSHPFHSGLNLSPLRLGAFQKSHPGRRIIKKVLDLHHRSRSPTNLFQADFFSSPDLNVTGGSVGNLDVIFKRLLAVNEQGAQWLHVVERTPGGFTDEKREAVRFVPLLPGIA